MSASYETFRQAVNARLEHLFSETLPQARVLEAMRYSLLAGGKRIRPVLALAFCDACGGDWQVALDAACALELIHTYSLIHDDLPCMDNDDYRRGRLTNHKVYGEAGAVLAGDGLLTAAFSLAAEAPVSERARVQAIRCLANAAGPYGMVGGQQLDLEGEGKTLSLDELEHLHLLKTGALIQAGCELGVICAEGSAQQLNAAVEYARALGLAFQIRDDMLDEIGDAQALGKSTGSDEKQNKSTFVTLCGLEECQRRINSLTEQAKQALDAGGFTHTALLSGLADQLAGRTS